MSNFNRRKWIEERVEQSKLEIVDDMTSGRVPDTINYFGALHDWVDANEYGGLCDETLAAQCPTTEDWLDLGNEVQNIVHAWLVAGGAQKAVQVQRQARLRALSRLRPTTQGTDPE